MNIARAAEATTAYEFNCDLRRLYPWADVADPLWGSAIASVRPNEATTPHSHDEEETFVILRGTGVISVDEQTESIQRGDVIYLPRHSRHTVRNTSSEQPLEFLTIWWGSPQANSRMVDMTRSLIAAEGSAP
jgi:mannose-6-phosphate isomerase-like protein (cupin superfamily)